MAGRIPEQILENILNRINIVEIISEYIPLKRAGRNFRAICPFHHEKTPSFMVSGDRQIYHCFGCGAGGNAFAFLMQHERIDFLEAVEVLAKRSGVDIPKTEKQDAHSVSLVTQIYKVNELTADYYEANLHSNSHLKVREYLLKRGIAFETMKLFKLGFATDDWDGLINHLRAKGVPLSLMEKAGLVIPKNGGGYYDRFRNRIIFPILDIKSRVLGFGARVLGDTLPKYINSPETLVYVKGRNLYGLNLTKDSIRQNDCVVIVEGYMDFIALYQNNLSFAVASSGTALTLEQVRFIKRYTHNAIMVYDGDASGQSAMLRTLDIFIEEEINVRVVALPDGLDPDSFVRKNGMESFKALISEAESLFDYKLRMLKKRYNLKEIEGKAMISTEMLPSLNKFKNAILKSEYIKRLAQELNVKEEALFAELAKINQPVKFSLNDLKKQKAIKEINPTEKLLVKLMLEERELINYIRDKVEPADFQDERTSRIVSLMFELMEQGRNVEPNTLLSSIGNDEASRIICESAFSPEVSASDREKIVDDCIVRLKNNRSLSKRVHLQEEIKLAQEMGDESRLKSLMEEFQSLIKSR